MNQTKFKEICNAAGQALQLEASEQDEGRCSLSIDGIDVLLDLDQEADIVHCYVDLGDPNPEDRTQVCEQLLELNLRTHASHSGAYAFDIGSARAIFCGSIHEADAMSGEELAEVLRYFLDETDEARQIVATPGMYAGKATIASAGALFMAAMA